MSKRNKKEIPQSILPTIGFKSKSRGRLEIEMQDKETQNGKKSEKIKSLKAKAEIAEGKEINL